MERSIKLTCNKRNDDTKVYINNKIINNGYEIKGCGTTLEMNPLDGNILVRKDRDPIGDDCLSFYWVCPLCGMIHPLDEKLLTYDEKLEIMHTYAGIADEMYSSFLYKKIKKDLKKQISEIEALQSTLGLDIAHTITDENRDTSKLYPNWEESSVILKRRIY